MAQESSAKLYSPELLALAVELAKFPVVETASHHGNARSRTCGSSVEMSLDVTDAGAVEHVGLRVSACAVGQAAAAIFASSVVGKQRPDLELAMAEIEAWLGGGAPPHWPGFEPLLPAREFKGRHGALSLPWRAALEALPNRERAG